MNTAHFNSYKEQCLKELSEVQEEFTKMYDINSYEHWFYDHKKGTFHFKSDNGRNLYFKYVDVGSYSTKRNTWLWSWDNKSTPKHVSKGLEKVRAFGEEHGFEMLTQGLQEQADEYTGWALTAITARLSSAIGLYRVPQDHLFIFFVFTSELTQEQFDVLENKYVECDSHGADRVAFVCQHLLQGTNLGFHEYPESDPSCIEQEDDYQAWCDACETEWEKEREWNETFKAFTSLRIVCNQCYFGIKGRNI